MVCYESNFLNKQYLSYNWNVIYSNEEAEAIL